MINFRYHVVSILAVFLALAIGTVMGASFVGQSVIDGLRGRIDDVEKNKDSIRDDNTKLTAENERLQAFIEESAPFAVAARLTGMRINLVAERGVAGDTVDAQAKVLLEASAVVPGVIWLEDRWQLGSDADATALRNATGLTNRSRETLRTAAARLLGQRLAGEPPAADDLLTKLGAAQFITVSGVAGGADPPVTDFSGTSARLLSLGGPGHAVPPGVSTGIGAGALDANGQVAVGQVFAPSDSTTDRSAWIDVVTDTDTLRGRVSTINDLELVEGQIGATLALDELGRGKVGTYGIGEDHALPGAPVPTAPPASEPAPTPTSTAAAA